MGATLEVGAGRPAGDQPDEGGNEDEGDGRQREVSGPGTKQFAMPQIRADGRRGSADPRRASPCHSRRPCMHVKRAARRRPAERTGTHATENARLSPPDWRADTPDAPPTSGQKVHGQAWT